MTTPSQRRRAKRLRDELDGAGPAEPPEPPADDPVVARLGKLLVDQQRLDKLEEAEALASTGGRYGSMPPRTLVRQPDFERGGVRRLPGDEQLLAARRIVERLQRPRPAPSPDGLPSPPAPAVVSTNGGRRRPQPSD
jgi:hypothetical protein